MKKASLIFSAGRYEKILSSKNLKIFKQYLEKAVELAKFPARKPIQCSFATKKQIRELKKRFWGINTETDVISFRYDDDVGDLSAEIIICPDVARERAPEFGNTFARELLLYAIHGILHLCGENDSNMREREKMQKREREIFRSIEKNLGSFDDKIGGML